MTPANVISVELLVSGPSAIPVASICSFLVSAVETLGLQAWHLPGILFAFVFWRQCLSMQPRLTLNFLSSYLSLLSAGVLGTTRHTWLNSENSSRNLGCTLSPSIFCFVSISSGQWHLHLPLLPMTGGLCQLFHCFSYHCPYYCCCCQGGSLAPLLLLNYWLFVMLHLSPVGLL